MYLTQWILSSQECQILEAFDNYKIHQLVNEIFDQSNIIESDRKPVRFDIINKNDNDNLIILIQSENDYVNLPAYGKFNCKFINISNYTEGKYIIEVKLNAIKQISIPGKKNKNKIPVIGVDNIKNWLNNKQNDFGINIKEIIDISSTNRTICYQTRKSNNIVIDWHNIKLLCTITDLTKFHNMIINGIGGGKSFGCSLVKAFKK